MNERFPRIFLGGFMGSGKSTLGRKLALLQKVDFIDLDQLIEEKEGRKIPEIFSEKGEVYFRQLEQELLLSLCKSDRHFVCSLGGGSCCNDEAIKQIKNSGYFIYIELPAKALAERLKHSSNRPLLANMNEEQMLNFISETLSKREKYYLQADLVIKGISLTAQEIQQRLKGLE